MEKRLKSGLITLVSILGTAFVAVSSSTQMHNFVIYVQDRAVNLGVPAVVIALIGVIVAEAWKAWLNSRTIAKASQFGSGTRGLDLY